MAGVSPGAEVGAASRAGALAAIRSFGDDFGPSPLQGFPCSTEARGGF